MRTTLKAIFELACETGFAAISFTDDIRKMYRGTGTRLGVVLGVQVPTVLELSRGIAYFRTHTLMSPATVQSVASVIQQAVRLRRGRDIPHKDIVAILEEIVDSANQLVVGIMIMETTEVLRGTASPVQYVKLSANAFETWKTAVDAIIEKHAVKHMPS